MYSIAQLEARPSVTKEASSCGSEHKQQQQPTLKERANAKKNNYISAVVGDQKVQKQITKSVRIVEPPKVAAAVKTRAENTRRASASTFVNPAAQKVAACNSSLVNRPRSVTDALFAAAPEVVPQTGPTPAVVAAPIQERKTPLPEEMNKGFLQFAEVDPELTSEYCQGFILRGRFDDRMTRMFVSWKVT